MFGALGRGIGSLFGGTSVAAIAPSQVETWLTPPPAQHGEPRIYSDIWGGYPYRGPDDLDNYGNETPRMRAEYRFQYRADATTRAAVRGAVDSIAALGVSVIANDKDNPFDRLAAEFVKWTIDKSGDQISGGWDGLFDSILTPARIDGWSICEPTAVVHAGSDRWPHAHKIGASYMWGLRYCRSLDTNRIRLELDQFRNIRGIVNLVRGLEYYDPSQVILYSHNPLHHNPFGQSDIRATTRAANIMTDAWKSWYLAVKVYGDPFFHGKTKDKTRIGMLTEAMKAIKGNGYAVTSSDDEINVLNLAAATGTSSYADLIKTLREEIFLGIRGAYLPYMEGQGGEGAHGNSEQAAEETSSTEQMQIKRLIRTIEQQVFPWLVRPNFPVGTGIPRLRLGGHDWDKTKKLVEIIKTAREEGVEASAKWAHDELGIPPPEDESDKLVPKPPAAVGPGGMPGAPGGAPGQPPGPPPAPGSPPSSGPPALPPGPTPKPAPAQPEKPADSQFAEDRRYSLAELADEFLAGVGAKQFSEDEQGHEHAKDGKFAKKGAGGEKDEPPSKDSPHNPPTTVDKPTSVGDTTGVGSHGAAPKPGVKAMTPAEYDPQTQIHDAPDWLAGVGNRASYEAAATAAGVEPEGDKEIKRNGYALKNAEFTPAQWQGMSRADRVRFKLAQQRHRAIEAEAKARMDAMLNDPNLNADLDRRDRKSQAEQDDLDRGDGLTRTRR